MCLHPLLPQTTPLDPKAFLGSDLPPLGWCWSLSLKLGGIFPGGTIALGGVYHWPLIWSCHSGRDSPQEETPLTWARLPGRWTTQSLLPQEGFPALKSRPSSPVEGCPGSERLELATAWERILLPSEGALHAVRSPLETAAHRDFSWVGEPSFCCAFLCFLSLSLLFCCPRKTVHWGVHRHQSYKPAAQSSPLQTEELVDTLLWVYVKTGCAFSFLQVLCPESLAKIFLSGLHHLEVHLPRCTWSNTLRIPGSCVPWKRSIGIALRCATDWSL